RVWGSLGSSLSLVVSSIVSLVDPLSASFSGEIDRLPQRGRKVRVALHRDGPVVHEDHLGAPGRRWVARAVARRGFELRQEHLVGLRTVQVLRQTGPIGEPGTPPDHSASVGPLGGFPLSWGHPPAARGGKNPTLPRPSPSGCGSKSVTMSRASAFSRSAWDLRVGMFCSPAGLRAMVTTTRSDSTRAKGPRYPPRYSGGAVAGTTRIPASHGNGGIDAPLPSTITVP